VILEIEHQQDEENHNGDHEKPEAFSRTVHAPS